MKSINNIPKPEEHSEYKAITLAQVVINKANEQNRDKGEQATIPLWVLEQLEYSARYSAVCPEDMEVYRGIGVIEFKEPIPDIWANEPKDS